MSAATGLENVLRLIAAAAAERKPLPAELRARGGVLGVRLAAALERGEDLVSALAGQLPEDLRAALRGPRPPLERSALLAAERLRLERESRLAWVDALAHPLLTVVGVAAAVVAIMRIAGTGLALPWILTAIAVLVVGAALVALARAGRLGARLPALSALGHHLALAQRYERAALVARWRLNEAELAPLLGADLGALAPVLADPAAEQHCHRLATYHAAAALRARKRLAWMLAGVVYIAVGALLLAAAVEPMRECVEAICAAGGEL